LKRILKNKNKGLTPRRPVGKCLKTLLKIDLVWPTESRYKYLSPAQEKVMTDKIEARIRQHYCAENGEWLIEKGKVKEAKLLKEACETIESLRNEVSQYWRSKLNDSAEQQKNVKKLEEQEMLIKNQRESLNSRINDLIATLERWKTQ
jgi:adenosyl cobinamide kinase/adenosyl cobinamide phosphate guanylyltransferase